MKTLLCLLLSFQLNISKSFMPDKSDDSGGDIRGRVYVLPIYNACQVTGAAV